MAFFLLATILTLMLPGVLASGLAIGVRPRLGSVWAVVVGTLTLPAPMAVLAAWALIQPNPGHRDGTGILFAVMVTSEPVTVLIGLAASLLTILLLTRLLAGKRQSDRAR